MKSAFLATCASLVLGLCSYQSQASEALHTLMVSSSSLEQIAPIRIEWLVNADAAAHNCSQLQMSEVLGLGAAIDAALCFSPRVRSAWMDVKIQDNAVGEAASAYYPTASVSVSKLKEKTSSINPFFETESVDIVKNSAGYGSINWRILDFGERSGNYDAAQRMRSSALAQYQSMLHETRKKVIAAYFDVLVKWGSFMSRQEIERLNRQLLEVVRRREAGGSASVIEVSRSVSGLANASLELSRARVQYDQALLALSQLLGVPVQQIPQKLDGQEQQPCKHEAIEAKPLLPCLSALRQPFSDGSASPQLFERRIEAALKELLEELKLKHPAIRSMQDQVQSNLDKAKSLRAQMLPKLDFVTNVNTNGSIAQGLSATRSSRIVAGVTLTIPLFDGFGTYHRMESAIKQAYKREIDLEMLQMEVINEVLRDKSGLSSALVNLESSHSLQQVTTEALQSSRRRISRGESDTIEVLSAQVSSIEAVFEVWRAECEWQSARLQLLATLGVLGSGAADTQTDQSLR